VALDVNWWRQAHAKDCQRAAQTGRSDANVPGMAVEFVLQEKP
jgi:hypothetical protein